MARRVMDLSGEMTIAATGLVRRCGRVCFDQTRADRCYPSGVARRVFYRIDDRPDGQFDAVVTIEPATVLRCDGFVSLAEAEDWAEGLRIIMAAIGAPVARDEGIDAADVQPATAKPNP